MEEMEEIFGREGRKILAAYWWQRAEGETTSWVAFQQVRRDLAQLDAHEQTLLLADRAVADERRHADWCKEWAHRFGSTRDDLSARDERPLRFEGARESLQPLLRVAFCAMTETLGCFVLEAQRPHIRLPALRRLNQRHLADEVQHSRVGWSFLATLSERQREQLRPYIPALCALLSDVASSGSEGSHEDLLGGGYFTQELLRQAGRDALTHVIKPGLTTHRLLEAA